MTTEEWRPVLGLEGVYEVSDHGNIRSVTRQVVRKTNTATFAGRAMKPSPTMGKYLRIKLGPRHVMVHEVVLEAFVGPRPPGLIALHADDDGFNNHVSNLSWGTRRQNSLDMVANGLHHLADRTHCHRGHEFTEENTRYRGSDRARICKECRRVTQAGLRAKKKLAAAGNQIDPPPVQPA